MADPNEGRFTWHELMTTDADKSVRFFTALFGWSVEEMDMGPAGKYRLFLQGGKQVGGAVGAPPGAPSHWLSYVSSEDPDATCRSVTAAGGKVVMPPTEIPNMVRFAVATDPQGAAFGVVKNLAATPSESPSEGPGTFCWNELHTRDQAAAGAFYKTVFGWTGKVGEGPTPYWHWIHAGKEFGGMMTLTMPHVPPNWLAYIAVSDVNASCARARELGAEVLMEPMDVEKVGRFGVLQDPTGAVFALFRSA